jgi:hypothetical protein
MSFLIGATGGWPHPSEYHMVERQVNNVTAEVRSEYLRSRFDQEVKG